MEVPACIAAITAERIDTASVAAIRQREPIP